MGKCIFVLLFVLSCSCLFAQATEISIVGPKDEKSEILSRMPAHTYERSISLKAGESIDLVIEAQTTYAIAKAQSANAGTMALMADPKAKLPEDPMPKEGFTNGWAFIEGRAMVNGCETTMVSWCADSKVHVVAITDCTLTIRGN